MTADFSIDHVVVAGSHNLEDGDGNICVLKIKKETTKIPQTVRVRQGNNMAPVLFLFLMTAFAETLETVQ